MVVPLIAWHKNHQAGTSAIWSNTTNLPKSQPKCYLLQSLMQQEKNIFQHHNTCAFKMLLCQLYHQHYVTPRTRVLEMLTTTQLFKKLPTAYEIWRSIITITSACHWSLSWATRIQSTSKYSEGSLQSFQLKFCMHFTSLTCVLHAPSISAC
jgi:hypothetical protein